MADNDIVAELDAFLAPLHEPLSWTGRMAQRARDEIVHLRLLRADQHNPYFVTEQLAAARAEAFEEVDSSAIQRARDEIVTLRKDRDEMRQAWDDWMPSTRAAVAGAIQSSHAGIRAEALEEAAGLIRTMWEGPPGELAADLILKLKDKP